MGIVYCVGEVMRPNVPGYEPYANEQKLWQREWPGLLPVPGAVNGLVEGL